jgi:hypothetical protein
MATFEVKYTDGSSQTVAGRYEVGKAGVLVVRPETGAPYVVSPTAWRQVVLLDEPLRPDATPIRSEP